MAEILVIRLPEIADLPAHWIAVDSSGARRSPLVTGPLHEALVDVGDRKVVVLVPSAEVLTTSVEIPVKGGARLLAALPYALEELLADDIDKLHFAAGARRPSGRVPVSVVSKAKLAEWRQRLADAGIRPSSIISENYGLARIPGTISMLIADEQILINDGAEIELTMQDVSPGDALAAIGALDDGHEAADAEGAGGLRNMPRHVLVYCGPGDEERYEHDWLAIRHELDSLDINLLPDGVTPRLAVTVATGSGMNLLQGEYAGRKEFSGLLRPWKFAAMLLVAFIGVGVVAKAIEYYSLTRQETALRELFQREYSALAPNAAEVRDPTAVVASLRARAGRSESPQIFLESLTTLSRALGANDAARLDAISYRSGVVDLRLTAPDVVTLDNIQRVIAEDGRFTASIQSTDQVDDRVNSRMQVQVRTP